MLLVDFLSERLPLRRYWSIGTRADMRCVTSTLNSGWFLIKKSQSGWKHSLRQFFTKMFNADSCSFGSECKSAQINKLMALLIFLARRLPSFSDTPVFGVFFGSGLPTNPPKQTKFNIFKTDEDFTLHSKITR